MTTDFDTTTEVTPPPRRRNWRPALVAAAAVLLIPVVLLGISRLVSDRSEPAGAPGTLLEELEGQGRFDIFVSIVRMSDFWVDTLSDGDAETVLAPPDEVFDALPTETMEFLEDPANERFVIDLLLRHIVSGEYSQEEFSGLQILTMTPPMRNSLVSNDDGVVTITPRSTDGSEVSSVSVVEWDIEASNGVIHVVDGVMLSTGP
jgi:uncharacterized surface protein with fasciclin (FAS1) repeats